MSDGIFLLFTDNCPFRDSHRRAGISLDQETIFVHSIDCSVNTGIGDNLFAFLQRLQHFQCVLLFFTLRTDSEEIHKSEDNHDENEQIHKTKVAGCAAGSGGPAAGNAAAERNG